MRRRSPALQHKSLIPAVSRATASNSEPPRVNASTFVFHCIDRMLRARDAGS